MKAAADWVDGGAFVAEVCEHLRAAMLQDRGVRIACSSAFLLIDADIAAHIALLVREYVAHTLRHAFPDGRPGHIAVVLSLGDRPGLVECSVEDDGIGLLSGDPLETGMGLTVIQLLARRFGGECRIGFTETGTRALIRFAQPPGHMRSGRARTAEGAP